MGRQNSRPECQLIVCQRSIIRLNKTRLAGNLQKDQPRLPTARDYPHRLEAPHEQKNNRLSGGVVNITFCCSHSRILERHQKGTPGRFAESLFLPSSLQIADDRHTQFRAHFRVRLELSKRAFTTGIQLKIKITAGVLVRLGSRKCLPSPPRHCQILNQTGILHLLKQRLHF